jgi:hypothetical protein
VIRSITSLVGFFYFTADFIHVIVEKIHPILREALRQALATMSPPLHCVFAACKGGIIERSPSPYIIHKEIVYPFINAI